MHFGSSQWRQALGTRYLSELDAVADQTALTVQRLARLHAFVALDAEVEVHHEQRVGLDHAELPAALEQIGNFGRDGAFLLEALLDDLARRRLDLRILAAQVEKFVAHRS